MKLKVLTKLVDTGTDKNSRWWNVEDHALNAQTGEEIEGVKKITLDSETNCFVIEIDAKSCDFEVSCG